MESSARSDEEYIFLTNGAKYWVGRVSEIVCLEVSGNYTNFLLSNGQRLMTRGSLAKWETRLPSSIFFKTGRDCIINLKHVKDMNMHNSKQFVFTLIGDNEVIVSRLQTIEFRKTRSL